MSDTPFASFISACTDVLALPPPRIENDRYMFQVAERWVELRYDRRNDRIILAAIAYVAPPEVALRFDLINAYNLRHLFQGGSCLIEGDHGLLYFCQAHQRASLDPDRIRALLIGFAERVATAGTWYIVTSEEQPRSSSLAPALAADDLITWKP